MSITRRKSFVSWSLVFEIMIIVVQPIPFYDVPIYVRFYKGGIAYNAEYLLSDFLLLFMFLRLNLVIRNFFNYS